MEAQEDGARFDGAAAESGAKAGEAPEGSSMVRDSKARSARLCVSAALWAVLAAAWLFGPIPVAVADQVMRMGLEDLARQADVILIGQVKSKETVFEDRLIQTRYVLAANQYLKGDLGEAVQITQVGGTIKEPIPLTQRVGGMVELFQGEKALLFLDMKNGSPGAQSFRQTVGQRAQAMAQGEAAQAEVVPPRPLPSNSPLLSTPLIVGGWQGRFTVFKDAEGRDNAVQLKSELNGLATDEQTLRLLRSVASRSDASKAAVQRLQAANETKQSVAAQGPEGLEEFVPPPALRCTVRPLDELKAEIRDYVERQKADGLKRAPKTEKALMAPPSLDDEAPSKQ